MITKTLFLVEYKDYITKQLCAENVVASDMIDAIQIIRDFHCNPSITLIQDKGTSVLVRSS